jgi:hypothetical protein
MDPLGLWKFAGNGAGALAILKRYATVDHDPPIALCLLHPLPFAGGQIIGNLDR